MIRISMNELSTYSWTFEEDVHQYAQQGFHGIGVWRQKLSDFGVDRGLELLRTQNLSVSNVMWAGGFTGCDGVGYQESIDDAIDAIQLASRLRAGCLVVYSGSRAGHTHNHARRMTRQALTELIAVAEAADMVLAIEPVHAGNGGEWSFLTELEDTVDFLESLSSPNLKMAFDTYHLGLPTIDLRRVEEIAHHVAIVHLADGRQPPVGEPNRCLLGDGMVPLLEIAAALRQGGFHGFWDVELMGEDIESYSYAKILDHSYRFARDLFNNQLSA